MEVSECGVSVSVYDTRVDVFFVITCESFSLVQQTVFQHVVCSQNDGQPFVVVDVLELGDQHSSGFLVQGFVIPVGVDV